MHMHALKYIPDKKKKSRLYVQQLPFLTQCLQYSPPDSSSLKHPLSIMRCMALDMAGVSI